jgi:hypothetical protein
MKWTKLLILWFRVLQEMFMPKGPLNLRVWWRRLQPVGFVLARTKTHRLKPMPLMSNALVRLALLNLVTDQGESPIHGMHEFSVGRGDK